MAWNDFLTGVNNTSDSIGGLFNSIETGVTNTSEAVKGFELPTIKTSSSFSLDAKTIGGILVGFGLLFVLLKKML